MQPAASTVTVTISPTLWVVLLLLLVFATALLAVVKRLPPRPAPGPQLLKPGSEGVVLTKEQIESYRRTNRVRAGGTGKP